ncbi:molybdopterin converting factor subunit 1 [Microbaculum marinisediminis]|uniref:Molybdopterin converting factor subunit 1 n=1 Tax=Microbaculum marinisediminis TaxID=2931392 RepID=A0AAW5QV73_9HYPH|nr:molybdopterin converting factor subunit 1 [Microbaculum sp. A6E488]MCT8971966.1 molybdopterin converting factor subunit 1 [Microbaculum sp. A6E488]
MKALYFAWIRERTGLAEEVIEPPATVKTAGDLIDWLKGRGEEFEYAFGDEHVVRIAIDRAHVQRDAPIEGAREIAFFPPMTGG